jgi:hypothetical protein
MFPILSPSSIRSLFQSPLRHPFVCWSNLLFVIDLITGPDLLFITDSLTVADMRFPMEGRQDEKRERRLTKEDERIEMN